MLPKCFKDIGELKEDNGVPLYQLARDRLAQMIDAGEVGPDTRLPSERLLSELFGISRMTARHVYDTLEEDGLVYRRDRRGWYVARQEVQYGLTNSVSFIENVRSKGKAAKSKVLDAAIRKPNDTVQRKLQLAKTARVYVIRRILYIDDSPTMGETLYAPASRFPGLLDFPLEGALTPIWYEHYDVKISRSEVQLLSGRFSPTEAEELEVAEGDFGIHLSHLYFDRSGAPVGYDLQKWRTDGVVFCLNLKYD